LEYGLIPDPQVEDGSWTFDGKREMASLLMLKHLCNLSDEDTPPFT
jgi:hypothetical protein